MNQPSIEDAARSGFADSHAYEAYRPSYPPEATGQLLSVLKVAGAWGASVADLAAGTGKFTELLVTRPEHYSIVAIEPHEGMRAELEKKDLRGVKVVKGTAENMSEIADGTFDALIASQAFHWFANRSALQEIYRVLKPKGMLGMIWNIEDYNAPRDWKMTTDWEFQVRDLTWSLDDDLPRYRHEQWRRCFEDQLANTPFGLISVDPLFSLPLGENGVKFETWLTRDDIWKRYRTLSQIAVLEGEKLAEVRKKFFAAINHEGVAEDEQGRVALHGHTLFAWTCRMPGQASRSGG